MGGLSTFGLAGLLVQFWHWGAALALAGAGAWLWLDPRLSRLPFMPTLALAAMAAAAFMAGQAQGFSSAAGRCGEAAVRATLAARDARIGELERQAREAGHLAEDWRARAQRNEQALDAANRKANDYEAELAKAPRESRCLLDGRDLRRMR